MSCTKDLFKCVLNDQAFQLNHSCYQLSIDLRAILMKVCSKFHFKNILKIGNGTSH